MTRFACDFGQLARIWIWVSSEVITILVSIWISCRPAEYFIACYTVLTRPNKLKQLSTVAIVGLNCGLYHVIAPLSFSRSITLALVLYAHCLAQSHLSLFLSLSLLHDETGQTDPWKVIHLGLNSTHFSQTIFSTCRCMSLIVYCSQWPWELKRCAQLLLLILE